MNGKELYNLCEHKKWDQVREYLLHSPDTNHIKKKNIQWRHNHGYNCCDWNSLQKACSNDPPVDIIQLMLDICGQSILFETDKYVQTPLHFACSWNASYDVVKLLVDVGGKTILMIQNEDGWTALHIACFHHENPEEIIKLFVTVGRKNLIEIENEEGETAMELNNGFYKELIESTLRETSSSLDVSHSSHGFIVPQAAMIEDEIKYDEMRQVISSLSFRDLEKDIENDDDISIAESSLSSNIPSSKMINIPDALPDDAHLFAKITFKWQHRMQGIFMSRELWDSQTFLEALRKCRILPAKKHHEERLFIVQPIGFPLTKKHAASFTTRQIFEMAGLGYGDNLTIEIVVQAIVDQVIELSDDEEEDAQKVNPRKVEKAPKIQPQSPPSHRSPRIVMDHKMQELEEMRIEFTQSPTRGRILLPDEETDDGWC